MEKKIKKKKKKNCKKNNTSNNQIQSPPPKKNTNCVSEMPHTGFDPDAFHAPHHSTAADMMTPVTWLLLAVLLVISGLLIYILFIHSTAQPTRRIP